MTGGPASPLLEREGELAALRGAVERAARGDGSLAVVSAHAGLGKTRLLHEACRAASGHGAQVLRGAGNELEREFSFGVALQLFEPAMPPLGAERDALFDGAASLVRPLLEEGRGGSSGEGTEFPFLHGLYWLTANLAERRPLVLAVDDLHWADRSSLRFLAYLAQRLDGLPVALAVAFRPHEPGAMEDVLMALSSHSEAVSLHPRSLGTAAVSQLVRDRFPAAATEFADACRELTEGNPLLLEALMRGVEEGGHAPSAETGARLAELAPGRVLEGVLARVARLPAGAPALARAVAVLGPSAHLRTVAELASLDSDSARRAADALAVAEVLRAGDPLRFVHPLLRQVIYDDVPDAERASTHRRAARLLNADGAAPNVVASHLLRAERAGDDWTVRRLEAAAAGAQADGSPGSAVAYLRRALEEPPPTERRAAVTHALGRAEAAAGERQALERLAAAVEMTQGAPARAEVALDYARALHSHGPGVEAAAALDRALAALGPADEQLARELEASWVSVARLALPLREEAVRRLAAIVEHPHGDTFAERLLLAQASGQLTFAGEPREQGCALAERALADGTLMTEGGPDDQGWLIALASYAWSDDFETAERGIETCLEDARRRGLMRRWAYAIYGLHLTRHYAGRLVEAMADAQQAIDARQFGWREYLPAACGQMAWSLLERAELEAAERVLSLPELDEIDAVSHVLVFEARARLHTLRGDSRRALADALESGKLATAGYVLNPSLVPWRSTAAIAATQLGELDQARELVDDDLRRSRRFGAPRPIGVALRAAGLVEGGDDGIELLREAVTTLADSPATLEHTRALVDLGAALRRRGHRAEARGPLREALDHRRAARPDRARAARARRARRGRRPPAPARAHRRARAHPRRAARRPDGRAGYDEPEIAQRSSSPPKPSSSTSATPTASSRSPAATSSPLPSRRRKTLGGGPE